MRERITAFIAIFLLLLLIAASYWYAIRSTYSNLKYVPNENSPDFIAQDATLISFDSDGFAKIKLQAQDFKHYSDDRVTMQEPHYTSVSPNKPIVQAKAKSGYSNDGGATVHFLGDVEVSRVASNNNEITRIQTQSVTVFSDHNRFETEDFVRISSGENTATATGMILDNIARTVELKTRVKTISSPQSGNVDLLPGTK